MGEEVYTIGYVDYVKNEIESSNTIYPNKNCAFNDLNLILLNKIKDEFDIYLQNKYIFPTENTKKSNFSVNSEYRIQISNETYLMFERSDKYIDIFFSTIKKGYLYNSKNYQKYYKFFINTHIQDCNDKTEPSRPESHKHTNLIRNLPNNYSNVLQELSDKIKTIKIE